MREGAVGGVGGRGEETGERGDKGEGRGEEVEIRGKGRGGWEIGGGGESYWGDRRRWRRTRFREGN